VTSGFNAGKRLVLKAAIPFPTLTDFKAALFTCTIVLEREHHGSLQCRTSPIGDGTSGFGTTCASMRAAGL
jgi:hypothetical protein